MKILHVITGLGVGGAERMLLQLVQRDAAELRHSVVSLTDSVPLGREMEAAGIPVRALHMSRARDLPRVLRRIRRIVRDEKADVVQTWLYHADLAGGLATWGLDAPVAWNLRHSDLSRTRNKRATLWVVKICARLSRWVPTQIITCSAAAAAVHEEAGYDGSKMVVIPNGFDTERFSPSPGYRGDLRRELGVRSDALLSGTVGRYHPQKDPDTLIEAAAQVLPTYPWAHLVLVGSGYTSDNRDLARLLNAHDLRGRVHLLGIRRDVARIDAALDVFISSSAGEAFQNAVGEAMSCGVPCVVTDVGDARLLVGDTGIVVAPLSSDALAAGWSNMLLRSASERQDLGALARRRIQTQFSMAQAHERYLEVWAQMAAAWRT